MVTISHIVKSEISSKPTLQEFLARGLVNYAALAESMQKSIEKTLGKNVKISAIVMAIRRYEDSLNVSKPKIRKVVKGSTINMKTGLSDISIMRSLKLYDSIEKLQREVNYAKGDTLNIIHGNHEASIIFDSKYDEKFKKILGKNIGVVTSNLVSVSLSLNEEYVKTPGVIFSILRHFAWENINLFEIISTTTEISFIVKEKDAMRTYNALQNFIS